MKFEKTFDVNYYMDPHGKGRTWSHKYSETWALTEWHCPKCGKTEVWEEQSGGDYYVGVQYMCTACSFSFYMPTADDRPKTEGGCSDQDWQRLRKLTDT